MSHIVDQEIHLMINKEQAATRFILCFGCLPLHAHMIKILTADHELSVTIVHIVKSDTAGQDVLPLLLLVVCPSLIAHASPCMNVEFLQYSIVGKGQHKTALSDAHVIT